MPACQQQHCANKVERKRERVKERVKERQYVVSKERKEKRKEYVCLALFLGGGLDHPWMVDNLAHRQASRRIYRKHVLQQVLQVYMDMHVK